MDDLFDVLIVGYGPAGATAANLLGQRGYRVRVIDQATEIYDKPRAITADQEVMRVFQECGLSERIAPTTTPHPGTDFVGMQGQVIKQFYPQPAPHLLGWEPTWMFVQPELEAVLRAGVARYPQVSVGLGQQLLDLSQTGQTVSARIRDLASGREQQVQARYLLAADGARSLVRQQMGAGIEDLAFDEWWIVVDAWLERDTPLPPRCVQYCRPSRPGTYIVGPGTLRRWEIKLLPGERPEDFQTEAAIRQVLASFVDDSALRLCRSAVYRFHALVVQPWRFGRVFLMGDAAHQMPPFLGQGLCAAIRDASNLVWKIDAVERLGCAPALLDTYGEERAPHVRTIVSHAKAFGLIIGELDVERARQRDAQLHADLQAGRAETVRQKFIPGLEAGLLDKDAAGQLRPGAGSLLVQPWVSADGAPCQRLDELLRPGFRLVATRRFDPRWWQELGQTAGPTPIQATWQALEGQSLCVLRADDAAPAPPGLRTVRERDGLFNDWLDTLGAAAVLVRPDHYVYGLIHHQEDLHRALHSLQSLLEKQ